MRWLPAQVEALTFMVEVVDVVGTGHRHLLAGGALWPADNPVPLWKAAGIWPKSKDTSYISKQGDGVPPASPSVRWTRARKTRCHAISPGLQSRGSCRGGQVPRRGTHPITSHHIPPLPGGAKALHGSHLQRAWGTLEYGAASYAG